MTRLLLDTHFVLRIAGNRVGTSAAEDAFLEAYTGAFVVSAISIWEVTLKHELQTRSGQPKLPISGAQVLDVVEQRGLALLPLSARHAATALDVPFGRGDPFDRMLLRQAQAEGMRLLTRDRSLATHPLAFCIVEPAP